MNSTDNYSLTILDNYAHFGYQIYRVTDDRTRIKAGIWDNAPELSEGYKTETQILQYKTCDEGNTRICRNIDRTNRRVDNYADWLNMLN